MEPGCSKSLLSVSVYAIHKGFMVTFFKINIRDSDTCRDLNSFVSH